MSGLLGKMGQTGRGQGQFHTAQDGREAGACDSDMLAPPHNDVTEGLA